MITPNEAKNNLADCLDAYVMTFRLTGRDDSMVETIEASAKALRDLAQQVEDLQADAARYRGLRARGIRRMVFEDEEDADKQADEAIK